MTTQDENERIAKDIMSDRISCPHCDDGPCDLCIEEDIVEALSAKDSEKQAVLDKLDGVREALKEVNRVLWILPNRPIIGSEAEALIFAQMHNQAREALQTLNEIMGDKR